MLQAYLTWETLNLIILFIFFLNNTLGCFSSYHCAPVLHIIVAWYFSLCCFHSPIIIINSYSKIFYFYLNVLCNFFTLHCFWQFISFFLLAFFQWRLRSEKLTQSSLVWNSFTSFLNGNLTYSSKPNSASFSMSLWQ